MMTPSISDVAARAAVSRTTVSHAISGKRFVSPDVRRRVEAAMKELGYVPSRSARNLALGRTQIIGLLVPDIANGFFADVIKGAEDTAVAAGYNLIVGNTGFDQERELFYLEMIRSRAVDGILYAAGANIANSKLSQAIGDIPMVLVDEELADSRNHAVVSDNYDGGRQAAEHLLSLGHRDALVLAAPASLLSSARRVSGFTDAWRSVEGTAVAVSESAFTFEGGAESVIRHQADLSSGKISAIFAVNDLMATGAIGQLRAMGLRIPQDVSVVGFDDSQIARYGSPALTTIRQDGRTLGTRAAGVLTSILNDANPESLREVLPVSLVLRESTGPAAEKLP